MPKAKVSDGSQPPRTSAFHTESDGWLPFAGPSGSAISYLLPHAWRIEATNTPSPCPIAFDHWQKPATRISTTILNVSTRMMAEQPASASICAMVEGPVAITAHAANTNNAMTEISRLSQIHGRV